MSSSAGSSLLLAVPYFNTGEVAPTRGYAYDNTARGSDRFVIIQRTESGAGEFRWRGTRWAVPAGRAFVAVVPEASWYGLPAGRREPWVFSWINIEGELGCRVATAFRRRFGPVLPMAEEGEAARAFYALASPGAAPRDRYEESAACFAFLSAWMRELDAPGGREGPVESLKRILVARYREPLSMKALAAEAGYSREHLTRLFVAELGVGPSTFLRGVRAAEARALASRTSLPDREIAARCGFPSARAMRRALAGLPHPLPGRSSERQ